jgi:type II secretory pathway predicted ATPase ExeA
MDTLITAAERKWKGCAISDRQQYIVSKMHVNHPAFVMAADEIKRRMNRCLAEKKGSAVLVLSPSGGGKTHLRNFLKEKWPDEHEETITRVRVIAFDIPLAPTPRAMGQALLKSLDDGKWESGSALHLFDRIKVLVEKMGTHVIIIDNVQDIPEKRKIQGILHLGNWIRDLIDATKILVVLVGTPAAHQVCMGNAQLRRRTPKILYMPYFSLDGDQFSRYLRFLQEVDENLPLDELSNLSNPIIARKIHWASFGIPDYIFQLLAEAVEVAVKGGSEKLRESDLEKAFDHIFFDAGIGCNPFSKDGPQRPLTAKNEPFSDWYDSSNPQFFQAKSSIKTKKVSLVKVNPSETI